MITIGDPSWRSRSGEATHLRLVGPDGPVALICGDSIRAINVHSESTGSSTFKGTIIAPPRSGVPDLLSQDSIMIEVLAIRSGDDNFTELGSFYPEHSLREWGPLANNNRIEVSGRSFLAPLIDTACEVDSADGASSLESTLGVELCALREKTGPDGTPIYVNSSSAYAVLRMLALTFDLLIAEGSHHSGVRVTAIGTHLDEGPPVVIAAADIKRMMVTSGSAIRRRNS